ncbi:MAG TPA: FtsX-like permease family protein [Terriglobales bacterium]|nr:FtsX-like permease family protein [Terriglobales bacterium]
MSARPLPLALRELRSAPGRFLFVALAVALGVGALVGVRSFSQAFRGLLLEQARGLMAGDLALRAPAAELTALTAEQRAALAGLGEQRVRWTRITESVSMVAAGAGAAPVLATLKAVDPSRYPFDGAVATAPAGALARLDDQTVLASPDLLLRTGLAVGGRLAVGAAQFRILGVDQSEPDRLAGGIGLGPRLLLTPGGLRRTGIIQFGSQVSSRLVFQLAPGSPPLAAVEARLRAAFPHARLQDYRQINPTVARGLDHATSFLSLISLVALMVGGLGVASAMQAHLALRMDAIATLKVLGARHRQIVAIYGLQTLLLGLGGGVLGVGLGALVERAFPRLLAPFFPNLPALGWAWGPALEGLLAGVLVALLVTLPTLLGLRRIAPAAILRRHMVAEGPSGLMVGAGPSAPSTRVPLVSRPAETARGGMLTPTRGPRGPQAALRCFPASLLGPGLSAPARPRLDQRRAGAGRVPLVAAGGAAGRKSGRLAPVLTGLVLLLGLAGLAAALTDEPWRQGVRLGGTFLLALGVGLAVLWGLTWALLRGLRWVVGRWRNPPTALRHGLANLYRPGSQAPAVLVALGLGVMFTLSVFLLQRALVADLERDTPPGVANVFLIDIPAAQAGAVEALLRHQPGREGRPEILRTVAARLETATPGPRRNFSLAAFAAPPAGIAVVGGSWWRAPEAGEPQMAASTALAARLGLRLGQTLTWSAGGRHFTARLAALYRAAPHRLIARIGMLVSPGPLDGITPNVNGGVRMAPAAIPELERAMFERFPTVTVLNLADIVARVQAVVDQVALVVHFVTFFAVLAAAVILASSIAGTRFRRLREMAVLKTFGATRGAVARIFSVEFLLLGLVAGAAGAGLGLGFSAVLARGVLELPLALSLRSALAPSLIALAAAAGLAVATGWLACARLLGSKPLAILRGE